MGRKIPAPLFLFDIDGTLLSRAGPAHRESLESAVERVTGRKATTDGIPVWGMLDRDILTEMMKAAGIGAGEIEASMGAVVERAQRIYPRRCPDLRAKVCPGVRGFLSKLKQRGAVCGLVTGNLSRIGWTKMRRAGLEEYFRFGSFAEEGKTRGELARRAASRARAEGWVEQTAKVVLVGDHMNDVRAAKENGMVSVAVGTGVVEWDDVLLENPDVAVEDLSKLRLKMVW